MFEPTSINKYIQIKLPNQYFRKSEQQNQIKLLLAARRFRYTRIAVFSPGYEFKLPNNNKEKA